MSIKSRAEAMAVGAKCQLCALAQQDAPFVPSEGPIDAVMVFVGEGPGLNEVRAERPFVGASGVKLNELLKEAGVERRQVLVSNALLCRPKVPDMEGSAAYEVKRYMAWLRKENVSRRKRGYALLASPFECCQPRLEHELFKAEDEAQRQGLPNGAVVVPLGNFAMGSVMGMPGKARGIMKYRGSVIPAKVEET